MKQSSVACFHNALLIFAGAIALSSCGGGGGGSSSKQQPDPVVADFPIAYIERVVPSVDPEANTLTMVYPITDLMNPTAFFPGAKVVLKDRASALAASVDITKDVFKDDPNYDPTDIAKGYDVKDLSVSPDGTKLLFAMRAPFDKKAKKGMGPKWHIYEYDTKLKGTPRAIITSKIVADQGDDISPSYLPDGRILFSSTRQTRSKAILLDDGKPQFSANEEGDDTAAFNLHVMKDDGTGIEQITYNQSHDLQPSLTKSGKIIYTHWDQNGQHNNLSFYTANQDGTDVERHYGFLSMNVKPLTMADPINRLLHPQEMQDGRVAAILKPDGFLLGGDMVVVDTKHFFENTLQTPAGGGTGTAQNPVSILPVNIKTGTTDVSQHGRFSSLSPLNDGTNRLLVSWSQCRLKEVATNKIVACDDKLVVDGQISDSAYVEAEPFYGIWIYNMADQSQLPVVLAQEGKMLTEPITLQARTVGVSTASNIDVNLATKENVGILHIRSVYEMDGTFNNFGVTAFTSLSQIAQAAPDLRPARFVRVLKAVSIPDKETKDNLGATTYGDLFKRFGDMTEILAYAPVEPDGSVMLKIPSDVAFTLEVLDKDGKRIGVNHNNWLQLRPGETRTCNGCHDPRNLTSAHGRSDAEGAALNTGAATTGVSFAGTQRVDKLGAPVYPSMGETMAEFAFKTYFQMSDGVSPPVNLQRKPTVDLVFDDEWTDPISAKAPSFAYRYSDLAPTVVDIHSPTSAACMDPDGWTSLCRVIINYEQHIQPLWERARPNGVDINNMPINAACVTCHSATVTDGAGNTMAQVPAGYLELLGTKQAAGKEMLSYTQLLTGSTEQYLDENGNLQSLIPVCSLTANTNGIPMCTMPPLDANGQPTCVGVTNCQFEQDPVTGALLLDSSGNLIPLTAAVPVAATMSRGGARASAKFFNKFTKGSPSDTYSHVGLLNTSELKLLTEWLDLGGRYYNNPFDSVAK